MRVIKRILMMLFLATSTGAHAADFSIISTDQCTIRLSGEITQGDLQKIQQAIRRIDKAGFSGVSDNVGNGTMLCLDSPGGSYPEGLKIAELILKKGIQTVVDQGAQCYSACALIFMAGSEWMESYLGISRRLHVLGRLGFHAPYISGKGIRYDQSTLDKAFQSGMVAIGKLLNIAKNSEAGEKKEIFPMDLLAEMLMKGPSESLEIDTVKKAIRYKISLIGIPESSEVSKGMICTSCSNLNPLRPFTGCVNDEQVQMTKKEGDYEFTTGLPGVEEGVSLSCNISASSLKADPANIDGADGAITMRYKIGVPGSTEMSAGDIKNWHLYPSHMPIRLLTSVTAQHAYADQASLLQKLAKPLRMSRFANYGIEGTPYYSFENATLDRCEWNCLGDDRCQAFQFTPDKGCAFFDVRHAPTPQRDTVSGVKLQ